MYGYAAYGWHGGKRLGARARARGASAPGASVVTSLAKGGVAGSSVSANTASAIILFRVAISIWLATYSRPFFRFCPGGPTEAGQGAGASAFGSALTRFSGFRSVLTWHTSTREVSGACRGALSQAAFGVFELCFCFGTIYGVQQGAPDTGRLEKRVRRAGSHSPRYVEFSQKKRPNARRTLERGGRSRWDLGDAPPSPVPKLVAEKITLPRPYILLQ